MKWESNWKIRYNGDQQHNGTKVWNINVGRCSADSVIKIRWRKTWNSVKFQRKSRRHPTKQLNLQCSEEQAGSSTLTTISSWVVMSTPKRISAELLFRDSFGSCRHFLTCRDSKCYSSQISGEATPQRPVTSKSQPRERTKVTRCNYDVIRTRN